MRTSKEAREKLVNLVLTNPMVTKEELVQLLMQNSVVPPVLDLIDRELTQTVNRILAKITDGDGTRKVFCIRGSDATTSSHYNIELTYDAEALKLIAENMYRRYIGCQKSCWKIGRRIVELGGEASIADIMPELEAEEQTQ